MGRRILKISLIGLLTIGGLPQAEATIMHDPTSFVKFGEIAQQGAQMIGQISKLQSEIGMLNSVLGEPISGAIMNNIGQGSWMMNDFGGVLDTLSSPYGDSLSSLNNFSRNQLGTPDQSTYLFLKDYAKSKLFQEHANAPLSFQQQDEIQNIRFDTLKQSSIDSIALSGQQKGSLKKSNANLEKLAQQAQTDRTIQEEIRTTNQLLVTIAQELAQQKAILAQMLELKAAQTTQQMPVVFNKGALSTRGAQASPIRGAQSSSLGSSSASSLSNLLGGR